LFNLLVLVNAEVVRFIFDGKGSSLRRFGCIGEADDGQLVF